ncbi:hypothetical protein Tco_0336814 [Tanacetum coccineum]
MLRYQIRLRATSTRSVLTLKPLPKIDPKDKGKKVLEEEAGQIVLSQRGARIEDDRLLAARLQEEERETFTVEERAKFLYDTIAAQRRLSIHLVVYNEDLAIPEQTDNGKGISNPLMAGSLTKNTKPTSDVAVFC